MTFPSYSKNWKQMNLIQRWASVEHSRTTASIIINTCVLYQYLFIIQQRKTLCLLGKEHIFLTLWESLESQNQLSAHCFFYFFLWACGYFLLASSPVHRTIKTKRKQSQTTWPHPCQDGDADPNFPVSMKWFGVFYKIYHWYFWTRKHIIFID